MNRRDKEDITVENGNGKCQCDGCDIEGINIIIRGNIETEVRLCRHHLTLLYLRVKNYLEGGN